MRKNHEEEIKGPQAQIASSGLTVEVDALKSQDLAKIMADIWAQYDKLPWKNQEELDKYRSQQTEESTTVITTQSAEIEQLSGILLHLESELAQTMAEGQRQAQVYEALLNNKVELEAEISTYHCLLEDGKYFNLGDAWTAATPCKPSKRPSPAG
ncbi:Keratin, type I cytoskeletal 18 [Saguinus oedipus]|uniref:Keratin, type I cytoskeletal 18 n=1 Tax=Saguinus oedipus TaxID=9490 RepID=A0ABQ9UF56_SAGOE|nr:Keratin, type I cytoskeletal 18 [Saguinus oedipus]